jgi:glycosyltransferase involved in cell wall biosynthesis
VSPERSASAIPGADAPLRVQALVDHLRSGGAEFMLSEFAEVAEQAGVEFSVAALEPIPMPAPAAERLRERGGVEPAVVPVKRMVHPWDLLRVRRHLRRTSPDLVHTHLITADVLGLAAARSLGIPAITTIHADWWPSGRADRLRTWLAGASRRRCADTIIAVSESAKAAYVATGHDVAEHITVVRNGVVDRARPGTGARVRSQLGLEPDDLLITTLSTLRPEKNLEAAIDAVGSLRARFPRARLAVAGGGRHRDAVHRYATRLGDAVLLLGHREDSMELLDATDVLVHPSHFEAFPTTLLEAMAASVPVVATAVGGMLEIVEADVTGVLVPPPASADAFAAALTPLLESPELRARLGAAGRTRYEREFSAGAWAGRVRAVYDDVLANRSSSGPGPPRRWSSGNHRAGS